MPPKDRSNGPPAHFPLDPALQELDEQRRLRDRPRPGGEQDEEESEWEYEYDGNDTEVRRARCFRCFEC